MKSLGSGIKTQHGNASRANLRDLSRHFPGLAGRPGHTPAGAREGPVLGRGVARRSGSGPRSLAKYEALPLLSCDQTKPRGDPPEALHPQGPGLQLHLFLGLAAEARDLGMRP